jgi:hypothetical protein
MSNDPSQKDGAQPPRSLRTRSPMSSRRNPLLYRGMQNASVKRCVRCPYAPLDLAGHYDPEGIPHVCAKCDGQHRLNTNHYPRKAHRRQQCVTILNICGTVQPSVARSAMEGLALSAATPAKRPSVRRSALTASTPVKTTTADGCVDFLPLPDNRYGAHRAPRSNVYRQFDTVFCFALGGTT